jgi:hypothetical protein
LPTASPISEDDFVALADPGRPLWRGTPEVFVTLAGVSAGITMLFLGMRSVMEIGGVCAEGGPYIPRQPCPDGVPVMIIGGIWGGIIFLGLYLWAGARNNAPSLAAFAWPALFLSLGWNFFEFGFNPPGDVGVAWSWLICGVIFALMGGLPLWVLVGPLWRSVRGKTPEHERPPTKPLSGVRAAVAERAPQDLVGALERLDELHRSGGLTDAEFEAAKRKLLRR